MSEQDFSSDFIDANNVSDDDILTILSDVITEQKDSPTEKQLDRKTMTLTAKKYTEHKCDVEVNGKSKVDEARDNFNG